MSGEILFLAHRMPFPPNRGDKIRSHHILKALAQLAPVHVAAFADAASDWDHEAELRELAASLCLIERRKPLALAAVEALLRREPVSLAAYRDRRISAFVARMLAAHPIDTIYAFSGQMGQYVPASFMGRVVVDLVDVDSAKFEAYAAAKSWPLDWPDAREGRLLAAEEERLAHRADRTLLVSEAEAELLRSRLVDPARAQVLALRNGIDTAYFDPAKIAPDPSLADVHGPHLVFTGQMDYAPNIAAVRRVTDFILPALRQRHPYAQFHVVGRAPTREVLALDWQDGVRVWGEVADVRPFLAAADLVVVPLAIARGVQNKVLEAMAAGRPVVTTSVVNAGLGAQPGEEVMVSDDVTATAAQVIALLRNAELQTRIGEAGRRFVRRTYDWGQVVRRMKEIERAQFGRAEAAR